jgi:hypothetical protein
VNSDCEDKGLWSLKPGLKGLSDPFNNTILITYKSHIILVLKYHFAATPRADNTRNSFLSPSPVKLDKEKGVRERRRKIEIKEAYLPRSMAEFTIDEKDLKSLEGKVVIVTGM